MAKIRKLTIPVIGEVTKQLPPSYINSRTAKWYNIFGKLVVS